MSGSILIVEDEEILANILLENLTKEGYNVKTINNGLKALIEEVENFDLIILDWMLPDFEGVDLLRKWRAKGIKTPVIMLTAKADIQSKVKAFDYGVNDYLTKFFEWEELYARIRNQLKFNNQILKIGDISFDMENEQFLENGLIINLTKKEYSILKYFFLNPNLLVTKQKLISLLYDFAFNPFSNVIERHIKSIRSKFNYDPITTVRGMGYRLKTK
jgi:two-component system, OmpR family, response regulator